MRLSLLGISIILFGIALILTSSGSATTFGLGISHLLDASAVSLTKLSQCQRNNDLSSGVTANEALPAL